jgi:penicillin-binding protein-related factor A (putative recombinase)
MSAGNRGKYAESKFRDECKFYENQQNFAFHRFPDAHAGSMVSAPADFQTCYKGVLRLIEVKETEQDNRLPYNNFAPDQVARMRMWQLAGGESWVLVYHKNTKVWRVFKVDQFVDRREDQGSWFFDKGRGAKEILQAETESLSLKGVFRFIHGMV